MARIRAPPPAPWGSKAQQGTTGVAAALSRLFRRSIGTTPRERRLTLMLLALGLLGVVILLMPSAADRNHQHTRPVRVAQHGAVEHEALRSHRADVHLGDDPLLDPAVPRGRQDDDDDAAAPTEEPTDAPPDDADDEEAALRKRKAALAKAIDEADSDCHASDDIIDELYSFGRQTYSAFGGHNPKCQSALLPLHAELPIERGRGHAMCTTADIPQQLLPRRKRRRGRAGRGDMWPSLKAHISAIDYVAIQQWKALTPFMMRICPPKKFAKAVYIDIGPVEIGGGSSVSYFLRNYPRAAEFDRIVAVAPDADTFQPLLQEANELLRSMRSKVGKTPGREDEARGDEVFARAEVTHSPRRGGIQQQRLKPGAKRDVEFIRGVGWNDTGYVTQVLLAPATLAPVQESSDGAPAKGRGGRIDIVLGPTKAPETPVPPAYPVRDDPPARDSMLDVYNDRMLPTVFHQHPDILDVELLQRRAAALDDGLGRRYDTANRTLPAVDVAETVLRYAPDRDDFVVLKLNAGGFEWMVLDRLFATGAMKHVDELLLVCHCRELNFAWNTAVTPARCQALVNTLRKLGVYAHEWYAY